MTVSTDLLKDMKIGLFRAFADPVTMWKTENHLTKPG
jgi:hypothetical protein